MSKSKKIEVDSFDEMFEKDHKQSRKPVIKTSKLNWFEKTQGFIGLTALVAGDIRMIQLESGHKYVEVALGGLFIFFAVSAVAKLMFDK